MAWANPISGTAEVCETCIFSLVNGEDIRTDPTTEPAPWAIWEWDTIPHVSPDYCPDHYAPDAATACVNCELTDAELTDGDDGYSPFGTADCDGCGSHLAGARFRVAFWEDATGAES